MALVAAAFVALVLYDYLWAWLRLRAFGVPYRLGVPLFYRTPFMVWDMDRFYDRFVEELAETRFRAFKMGFLGPVVVVSADPDVNKYILTNVDTYIKGETFTGAMRPLLGDGIFNVDGEMWLHQRKLSAFMFAKREVIAMVDVFASHFKELDAALKDGVPVEFQELASAFTLDCFCELAFGIESGCLRGENRFSHALNVTQACLVKRLLYRPYWKWFPFLFPSEKALAGAIATMDEFVYELIEDRRRDPSLRDRKDLLSALLTSDASLEPKYVRDILINFILAGRDTTAQTILWSTYLLSLPENAAVRDKVEAEARAVEGPLTYQAVKQLNYTERFVYETLRLYPPVPSDPKEVVQDDVLPGGIHVRKGDQVIWTQNGMGRLEHFFPRPLVVDPDRWLDAAHNGGVEPKVWSGGFIPFQNGGRRVCMGQDMALLEVKSTLAHFAVNRIRFRVMPGQKVVRGPNITICARYGITLIPEREK